MTNKQLGTLRNPEAYLESKWDWNPLVQTGCFLPNVAPCDLDGVIHLDSKDREVDWFIYLETKNGSEALPTGQRRMLEGLVRKGMGRDIAYVVRSRKETTGDTIYLPSHEALATGRVVEEIIEYSYEWGFKYNGGMHVKPTIIYRLEDDEDGPGEGYQYLVTLIRKRYQWMLEQRKGK